MEKNTNPSGETTHPSKSTIQVLIFAAGLLIGPLLSLGSSAISRILTVRALWEHDLPPMDLFSAKEPTIMRAYIDAYFSFRGLLTVVPLDMVLLLYIASVMIAIVTIKILAEAQLADDPKRADALILKADKYLAWILSLLVFFMIFEYSSALEFMQLLSSGNLLILLALDAVAALVVSRFLQRAITTVERSVAKRV